MIEQDIEKLCQEIDNASFDDHDALYEKVVVIDKNAGRGLRVGKILRFSVADGNALYFVTKVGKTSVSVRHIALWDQYSFAGIVQKGGGKGSINRRIAEQSVSWDDGMNAILDKSKAFYDGLKPGSIVHYNSCRNSYVRCQVMPNKQLVPIALVGNWQEYDLPRRYADGSICNGYHADSIVEHKEFQPHASNVYEYNITQSFSNQPIGFDKEIDPRGLAAIDLSVPPMTAEESLQASKYQLLNKIRELVESIKNPDETIVAIKTLLA